jgi:hypothetical protein
MNTTGADLKEKKTLLFCFKLEKKVYIPCLASVVVIGRFLPYQIVLSIWSEHIIQSPEPSTLLGQESERSSEADP